MDLGDRGIRERGRVGGGAFPCAALVAAVTMGRPTPGPAVADGGGGCRVGPHLWIRPRELRIMASLLARGRDLSRRLLLGGSVPQLRASPDGGRALRVRPSVVWPIRNSGERCRIPYYS